jgi:imidazolonepropionase-like amidohydrolase
MHVHLTTEIGARPEFGDGPLFLASGVTTVLNLKGDSTVLAWRSLVSSGQLVGPTIYTAGDFVNEPRVNTPEEAEREVRAQAAAGYDVIKVREVVDPVSRKILTTTGLSLDTYRRLMKTALELGIPVIGHIPTNLGYQASIDAGQSWAHLYAIVPVAHQGDTALRRVAGGMAKAGIWVTPTLTVYRGEELLATLPEAKLVGPGAHRWWDGFFQNAPPDRAERTRELLGILQHAVLMLHRAGVPLLAGTDALGWPGMIPGVGLHEEMKLIEAAGLSRFEVLRTATVEAARFLQRSAEFGTIEPGRRADLILVEGNPLEDLGRLRHPVAVMARGIWLDSGRLGRLVASLGGSSGGEQR